MQRWMDVLKKEWGGTWELEQGQRGGNLQNMEREGFDYCETHLGLLTGAYWS